VHHSIIPLSQDLRCKTSKTDIPVQEDQNKITQNQCGHLVQQNKHDQATNTKLHKNNLRIVYRVGTNKGINYRLLAGQ